MPRSNRQFYPSLDYGHFQNEIDVENSDSSEDSTDEENEIDFDWGLQEEDMRLNSGGSGSVQSMFFEPPVFIIIDLFQHLTTVLDNVLTFLAAACLERVTDAGFYRFLAASTQDQSVRREAIQLWKNDMSTFNKHYICNTCGKEVNPTSSCCGPIIKYIRMGGFTQLIDVVKQYIHDVLKIRQALKAGTEKGHNLNGSYLRKIWQSETKDQLKLSLIGSIDGVALTGNTKNKIWPVTMLIVDLPTADMQRATNLVMHGMAEGSVNPSTVFWNAIVPMIYTDIESQNTKIANIDVRFIISSWIADQPAKRALFGMKACNAENSCFFGMCSGTHHKKMAPLRCMDRPEEETDEDAKNGKHGFGATPPKILDYLYPYDTLIDLLHNASEGIIPLIISETMNSGRNFQKRSNLFDNTPGLHSELCDKVIVPREFEVKNMTNCSEKIAYFRIYFGLSALMNPSLKPNARLVISSLMLLMNQMYSNSPKPEMFYIQLTAAARWVLEKASETYLATKAHELVCHLPYVIEKFGNVAPLSTFSYEHFYKYCLKGFNSQKTNGFTEAAISRALLHSSVIREVQYRASTSPSTTLIDFLAVTPKLKPFKASWSNPIKILESEDQHPEIEDWDLFATLILSIGRLQSRYKAKNPRNEVFFALNDDGFHSCYRFLAVCVHGNNAKILAERIRRISPLSQFPLLKKEADEMGMPGNTYGFNVLTEFKRCDGIIHGKPSGEREIILLDSIRGMGAFLPDESGAAYYLQINGSCVHH